MPEVKPAIETLAKIKVVGVGGGGGKAVDRMMQSKIRGVEFIAVNTDSQDLQGLQVPIKIHIGKNSTRGLGAGMNPDLGYKAAEESQEELKEALKGADMVFITCGLGGGTGSGAGPYVAEVAKASGALTIAVVTKPFAFEGKQRKEIADKAYQQFLEKVDTIITIPNDRILQIIDKKTSLLDAFKIIDDVLRQGVQGISEIITVPGLINRDFADVRAVMEDSGSALMGIGYASGENRVADAAKAAISSPLLELSVDGAKGILFIVTASSDISMFEIADAAKIVTNTADENAKIFWGTVLDDSLKDEVKVTVFATGFEKRSESSNQATRFGKYSFSSAVAPTFNQQAPVVEPVQPPKVEKKSPYSSEPERPTMESKTVFTATPLTKRPNYSVQQERFTPEPPPVKDEEDDLEIPAFLRKKMN